MWGVIFLLVLALIVSLLLLQIRISIVYEGDVKVLLGILFFKFKVYPRDNKPDIKKFSAKGINQRIKQDRKKIAAQANKEKKGKSSGKKTHFLDTLKLVADILGAVKKRFFKHLRIKVAKLKLIVATDDAAKTALEYGLAVQGVQYIVSLLESTTNFTVEKNGSIYVDCDYCSEKTSLDLDITFSLRAWQIAAILIRAGTAFIMNSGKKTKTEN